MHEIDDPLLVADDLRYFVKTWARSREIMYRWMEKILLLKQLLHYYCLLPDRSLEGARIPCSMQQMILFLKQMSDWRRWSSASCCRNRVSFLFVYHVVDRRTNTLKTRVMLRWTRRELIPIFIWMTKLQRERERERERERDRLSDMHAWYAHDIYIVLFHLP